jgi:hypothetical protein
MIGKMTWLALAVGFALTGIAPCVQAEDNRLWQAVFALGDPAGNQAAESELRSAGRPGIEILILAARTGQESEVLNAIGRAQGCIKARPGFPGHAARGPRPAQRAAMLATQLIGQHPKLQKRLLRSQIPVELSLALHSLLNSPERLLKVLQQMDLPKHHGASHSLRSLQKCIASPQAKLQTDLKQALRKRIGVLRRKGSSGRIKKERGSDCLAEQLASGLTTGQVHVNSHGYGNGRVTVQLLMPDRTRRQLDETCALLVYERASQQGKAVTDLLSTLIAKSDNSDRRKQAARLLIADLPKLDEKARNKLAAKLVNAGFSVPHAVRIDPKSHKGSRANAEIHQAAVRQGSLDADAAIDSLLACSGSYQEKQRLALLGFAPQAEAAEAARIASDQAARCPDTIPYAAAALVRLQDPGAAGLLEAAWSKGGSASKAIQRAILEKGDRTVLTEVARLSKAGNKQAKRMLAILEIAGRPLD